MRKFLTAIVIVSTIATSAMAADTFSGALLNSVQRKIDNTAAPVVNKEREIKAKQEALDPRNKIQSTKDQQQALVDKKKQQIQAQKDLLNNQKNELKNIFTVK